MNKYQGITAEIMMSIYKAFQCDGLIKEEDKITATFETIAGMINSIATTPSKSLEQEANDYAAECVGDYSPELQQDFEDVKKHFLAGATGTSITESESTPSVPDAAILYDALKEIETTLGTISFSSHNQMKEAIEGGLNLVQEALSAYNSTEGQSQTGESRNTGADNLEQELIDILYDANGTGSGANDVVNYLIEKYHITRKQ